MSSSSVSYFIDASKQMIIYFGIPILIAGVIGGFLDVIIFRSIRIFRQSSCIFYLTIMSIVNIGQFITGLLYQIMVNGFNIDWTLSSVFYCKFKWYCLNMCAVISLTCTCLATIDQFLATCPSHRWHKWNNIKVAHTATAIFTCIWLIYGIPYLIYNNLIVLSPTGKLVCTATDTAFYQYHYYSSLWLIGGFLPVFINALFGLLTYFNVQRSNRRTLPRIRRELDRELTIIVFVQIIYHFFAIVPFLIVSILVVDLIIKKDPLMAAKLQFANVLTTCLYYLNFANPFYMCICVSHRFRRQFIYILFKIYRKRQHRRISVLN